MKYYYADKNSEKFLKSKQKRVYLYGGYIGYNNFGDIIQLKHAIHFHKTQTNLIPVIVLHLTALESVGHVQAIKNWFQADNLIFIADEVVNARRANLELLESITSGGLLHVYGGGYLNKYWGGGIIEKIDDILHSFNISHYVFSGQQIEDDTIPKLNKLFEKKQPLLVGVRDKQSLEWMIKNSNSKNVVFSFDDVTEIFQAWRSSATEGIKFQLLNRLRPKSTLMHINISSYATSDKLGVLDKIRKMKKLYPQNRVVLAHAYNDIRLSLRDTLQSVIQFANSFPYYEYKVVNIAQMALDINPTNEKYPNIIGVLSNVGFTMTSSYHTAMLSLVFDIPAFLMSDNKFYSQKQKSLGLNGDFDEFITNPQINMITFHEEIAARKLWLDRLKETVSREMQNETMKSITLTDADSVKAAQLKFKGLNS